MEKADKIGFFVFGLVSGIVAGIIIAVLNLAKDVDTNRFIVGDNVYCQEAIDNPVGDWRVGRIIEPDRLPPTKENCIQLFNSLN